jgi:3-hydroxybutyryl-CoA dehydratase
MEKFDTGSFFQKEFFVDEKLVKGYADLTGDKNPLHIDEKFTSHTIFNKCIAHGGLIFGFISKVIGTEFPGPGSVYVYQNLNFLKPIYYNSKVIVKITVKELLPKFGAIIQTEVMDESGDVVCDGEAKIKLPDWCKK